jgi:branched-chain amino acid transport system ATP-binding protein
MLEIEGVETRYGAIQALKGLDLEVRQGEIIALLGANGAGKSTTIKTITGLVKPNKGRIRFEGRDITACETEDIARMGIACVPEGRRIFPGLTVMDNLMLGTLTRRDRDAARIARDLDRVFEFFPVLREFKHRLGWQLSGGQQQMLAIARGLLADPRLMLLDEPSLGLAPVLVQAVFKSIREINRAGTTILLIEQNARMALLIAHRGYVLENGKIVMADSAANLLQSERMKAHYLGAHTSVKEKRRLRASQPASRS